MKFDGTYQISAAPEAVWEALNDPGVMRECIPGCEEVSRETPTNWTATVLFKVGPVKARFSGRIQLTDLDPPHGCTISGEGNGGAAGFAKGDAVIRLVPDSGGTRLTYQVDADIGGKIAQVGARLITGVVKKYADDFFGRFAGLVGAGMADRGEEPVNAPLQVAAGGIAPPMFAAANTAPMSFISRGETGNSARFDSQTFTIMVLAGLLVFMTIMFVLKP